MNLLLVPVLVAVTVAVVRARLAVAATVLFGVLFLVPGNLVLVGFPSALPVFRVVLWAYTAALVARVARGEISRDAFAPTRVQAALGVFLAVALVNGIIRTSVDNELLDATLTWLSLVDQFVVLTAVLVTARALGVRRVAGLVTGFTLAVAAIALWEHVSEISYARWVFQQAGKGTVAVAAEPLTPRGDQVRVRGPYQFALEFSWVAVMLLPLVTVWAIRSRRRLAWIGPAALALALLWSWSRSSLVGLGLGAVALAVASRLDRRTVGLVIGAGALCAFVLIASPGVRAPFDAADEDSAASRTRRLAVITDEVVDQPYTGLGLAGLRTRGIRGADASFTLVYAALGVPGVLTLAVAELTALGTCMAGIRHRRERLLAAAALAGVLSGLAGNFALDLVAVPGSGKTLWILAAIGAAVATDVGGRAGRASPIRWVAVPVAGAIGLVVASAWPTHVASTFRFETIERGELATTSADVTFGGRFLVNTACDVIDVVAGPRPPAKIECLDAREAPGMGTVRIESGDRATTEAVADRIQVGVQRVLPGFTLHERRTAEGRPTPIRTLPFTLLGVTVAAVALVPGRRPRDPSGRTDHPGGPADGGRTGGRRTDGERTEPAGRARSDAGLAARVP